MWVNTTGQGKINYCCFKSGNNLPLYIFLWCTVSWFYGASGRHHFIGMVKEAGYLAERKAWKKATHIIAHCCCSFYFHCSRQYFNLNHMLKNVKNYSFWITEITTLKNPQGQNPQYLCTSQIVLGFVNHMLFICGSRKCLWSSDDDWVFCIHIQTSVYRDYISSGLIQHFPGM